MGFGRGGGGSGLTNGTHFCWLLPSPHTPRPKEEEEEEEDSGNEAQTRGVLLRVKPYPVNAQREYALCCSTVCPGVFAGLIIMLIKCAGGGGDYSETLRLFQQSNGLCKKRPP